MIFGVSEAEHPLNSFGCVSRVFLSFCSVCVSFGIMIQLVFCHCR